MIDNSQTGMIVYNYYICLCVYIMLYLLLYVQSSLRISIIEVFSLSKIPTCLEMNINKSILSNCTEEWLLLVWKRPEFILQPITRRRALVCRGLLEMCVCVCGGVLIELWDKRSLDSFWRLCQQVVWSSPEMSSSIFDYCKTQKCESLDYLGHMHTRTHLVSRINLHLCSILLYSATPTTVCPTLPYPPPSLSPKIILYLGSNPKTLF